MNLSLMVSFAAISLFILPAWSASTVHVIPPDEQIELWLKWRQSQFIGSNDAIQVANSSGNYARYSPFASFGILDYKGSTTNGKYLNFSFMPADPYTKMINKTGYIPLIQFRSQSQSPFAYYANNTSDRYVWLVVMQPPIIGAIPHYFIDAKTSEIVALDTECGNCTCHHQVKHLQY